MYSLWCRSRPSRASARACSRVSAMCQLISTRQSLRSTVCPCSAAAASAKLHCVRSAFRPSSASRARAEDHPSSGHVVELHHALCHVERVVIRQRDDAGGELNALRTFASGGQEHLGRADHLPAAGMMLAAPELLVAELVQLLDEVEIATELEHRMLADRMVRSEERAEA